MAHRFARGGRIGRLAARDAGDCRLAWVSGWSSVRGRSSDGENEMSLTGAPPSTRGLLARVQNILLRPKAEWDVIAGETASAQGLILGYAAIVSALPALARIVNGFMPHCFFGAICVTPNPVSVVVSAVVYYLATLAA